MKKIICAILMALIAWCLINGIIEVGSDVINGRITIFSWFADHKLAITVIICYFVLSFVGPFKKG